MIHRMFTARGPLVTMQSGTEDQVDEVHSLCFIGGWDEIRINHKTAKVTLIKQFACPVTDSEEWPFCVMRHIASSFVS